MFENYKAFCRGVSSVVKCRFLNINKLKFYVWKVKLWYLRLTIATSLWYEKEAHDKSSVVNGRFSYWAIKTSGVFDRKCSNAMVILESWIVLNFCCKCRKCLK